MIKRELTFLLALWKANLLSAMEYRVSFVTQVIGMMLNNGIYFLFWVIFFERFDQVHGWELSDMFLLFGFVAAGFGLSVFLLGNLTTLAEIITSGRLDYYLALPRPVLIHTLASNSRISGLGDFAYGIISVLVAGKITGDSLPRVMLVAILSVTVFVSFIIFVHSLAFWLGNVQMLVSQTFNAMITFSIYPITLFDSTAKFILFTILPAALVGAVPVELIIDFSWQRLAQLLVGAMIFLFLALFTFHRGLRRYESGSTIQIQV